MSTDVRELTRRYFAALADGATGDRLAAFYDPDVVQEELPNALAPHGARRDLAGILAAAERGQTTVSDQRYEIGNIVVDGLRVAVEFSWSATVGGVTLRGRFAAFLEFRDGRIVAQRSYDCFDRVLPAMPVAG